MYAASMVSDMEMHDTLIVYGDESPEILSFHSAVGYFVHWVSFVGNKLVGNLFLGWGADKNFISPEFYKWTLRSLFYFEMEVACYDSGAYFE